MQHIRTEIGLCGTYFRCLDGLGSAAAAAGIIELGRYRLGPDRLLVLRGFASPAARQRGWTAFHASEAWGRHRSAVTDAVRSSETMLLGCIAPEGGIGRPRPDEPITAFCSELREPEGLGDYHLWLRLLLRKAGCASLGTLATLEVVNDVPAVPVVGDRCQHIVLIRGAAAVPSLPDELRAMLRFAPEVLRLEPVLTPVA
ncbi:MAG: hypothetical protein ABI697_00400 [Devosia sp.]